MNKLMNVKTILKGVVVTKPMYIKQEVEEYENNPYIEALPLIFEEDEVIKQFTFYPKVQDGDREKRSKVRHHLIKRLKNFTQPLDVHLRIERNISAMIRQGYLARNPYRKEYYQRLQAINSLKEKDIKSDQILAELKKLNSTLRSSAEAYSVIGISGIGKTTALEKLLLMYPQVIHHTDYQGEALTRTQIVWLKLDCPYDGSIKTLCQMFFKAVDDVLGNTDYLRKFGNSRNSKGTMMLHMGYLASLYGIGLLVIDEMQHLIKPRSEKDELLDFLVTLINTIGIPIVLVGTFKALTVLKKQLRNARRVCSEGCLIWDRMKQGDEWDFFLETMWKFQWLKKITPLDDNIRQVMYDESQGITALAVNIFILAQERAIFHEVIDDDGQSLHNEEVLTEKLIKETAHDDLYMIQPMVNALRNNDYEMIQKYEDISINIEEIASNIRNAAFYDGRISVLAKQEERIIEQNRKNIIENLFVEISALAAFDELSDDDLENIINDVVNEFGITEDYTKLKKDTIKRALEKDQVKLQQKEQAKAKRNKQANNLAKDDLRKLFQCATKQNKHIYDLLKESGLIKDPAEEFIKPKILKNEAM